MEQIIELIKIIILGIVEGITEWLPISSTGHMILVDEVIQLNASAAFKEMFLILIQLGAIMAVVVLYFKELLPFTREEKKLIWDVPKRDMWLKIVVACLPAAIIGIPFNDLIDKVFYNYQTVAFTLILYGVLFIVIENMHQSDKETTKEIAAITYKQAALIGVFQLLSIIPGTSRSGATIIGGMVLGLSRQTAAKFTFFLAVPVMFGASFIKLLKFGFHFTGFELTALLTGLSVAFVVSILAIKFLIGYIKKHDFKVFGYYRIGLGLLVGLYFLLA